jgi:hypothetical protein
MESYDSSHYNILTPNGICNILVALTIFSAFLSIFYFTYASYIENQILNNQIKILIDNLTYNIKDFNIDTKYLLKIINQTKLPDLTKEDNEVTNTNSQLIKKALLIFGVFSLISLIIIVIISYIYKLNIKEILKNNFILLIFVAITEIFFLNVIAKSYRSLDPNIVKKNFINNLQNINK